MNDSTSERKAVTGTEPFKVNLRGVVNLLAMHLYSSPAVFVRELLQNAVDAIEVRRLREPSHEPKISFEVDQANATLTVIDNGVGLTRSQIDDFLACVGATSKLDSLEDDHRTSFIGQFGIGILSAFMVSDEIIMLTRSLEPGSPSIEWRGATDGTYVTRELDSELAVGTRVILRLREDSLEYGDWARIMGLACRYGGCLEIPIVVTASPSRRSQLASQQLKPWAKLDDADDEYDHHFLGMGDEFSFVPLDTLHVRIPELGLEAMGYVLPAAAPRTEMGLHLLYLKGIFVTDHDVSVVPKWASFIRFAINSTDLNPTASRESIREDDVFRKTQDSLTAVLREYLHGLGRRRDDTLARFVSIHDSSLRQVALEDEEFFRLVIDLLPFETSLGTVRFGRFRAENSAVRLARTLDQFRACSAIAAAQGVTVFNGGYTAHTELLERAVALDPSLKLEPVDVRTLIEGIGRAEDSDLREFSEVLEVAQETLLSLGCRVSLSGFDPDDVPAVFAEGSEQSLARSVDAAKDESEDPLWDEILDALDAEISPESRGAFLCLNSRNSLVRQLLEGKDREVLAAAVRILYVQALLLGRQPVTTEETRMFGASLETLLTRGSFGAGGSR